MQTKQNDLQQYAESFSKIVGKYFPSWIPWHSDAYYNLCSYYVRMCRGEIVANVPCFDAISECLNLIEHLQMSGSGKFTFIYASIKRDYDVGLIEALKEGVLCRLNELVNKSVKIFEDEQDPITEYTFNINGLEDYCWYVEDGGKIASQDVWSDEALAELAKCCQVWKNEEIQLRGRQDKRILILGYYANEMSVCFPESAKIQDKHLCIYDLMRKSGFLDFCPESRLREMDNKDIVDRSTDVRDWIDAFMKKVDQRKNNINKV